MRIEPTTAEDRAGRLLSVGHSNHEWPTFLALLRGAGVTTLADVRSCPFSRYPSYNRGELERALGAAGIAYIFLGDLLGGRPHSPSLYDDEGRVDYERVRATSAFRDGLSRLTQTASGGTVAFLCSEEDPLDCHRGLMIAPALRALGLTTGHLRRDGSVETTEEMEARLLRETGVGAGLVDGLFAATLSAAERSELLAEAYRRMARRKAYRRRQDDQDDPETP